MEQSELIGIISERPRGFAWLLGAGTSRSAGLPTATDIIWDLKRRFYCQRENQEITQQDIQNEPVRQKIQAYMTSKAFPEPWALGEYPSYFEMMFGDDYKRQAAYLRAMLSEHKASLSVGNRVLGALMTMGMARVVFTTNFDTVVEKSVAEVAGRSLSAYHIEGDYAANDALDHEEYPLYCKLHGDFRYHSIKNLSADLRAQNEELSRCFVNACNRFGLVVTGYSGRDASVMELLRSVLQTRNPFPHGLYWTGLKRERLSPSVSELLAAAAQRGVTAEYVSIETFDALLLRLWRNLPAKPEVFDAKVRKTSHMAVNIPIPPTGNAAPLLRMNGLPISALPSRCLQVTLSKVAEWEDMRNAEVDTANELILTRAESVWAWGRRAAVKAAFGSDVVALDPLDISSRISDLRSHLHLKAFLEKALSQALARDKPLLFRTSRHRTYLIANRHAKEQAPLKPVSDVLGKLHGNVPGLFTEATEGDRKAEPVAWAEALQISIEEKDGRFWLLLDPVIWIWPPRERRNATEFLDRRRANRFNNKYDRLLTAWCHTVLGTNEINTEVEIAPFAEGDEDENPRFRVDSRTAFSRRLRA